MSVTITDINPVAIDPKNPEQVPSIRMISLKNATQKEAEELYPIFNSMAQEYDLRDYCIKTIHGQTIPNFFKGKKIPNITLFVIFLNNYFYSISYQNNEEVIVGRIAFHDERDPFPEEIYKLAPYEEHYRSTGLIDLYLNDKGGIQEKHHIDETLIKVDKKRKKYFLCDQKHGLEGSSGGGCFYIESDEIEQWEPTDGPSEGKYLLVMAQKLIDELRRIKGIEYILDFSIFDIIPEINLETNVKSKRRPATKLGNK